MKAATGVLTVSILAIAFLMFVPVLEVRFVNASSVADATVFFLNVGQGDAILITTNQRNMLIDGGPGSAENALLGYLWTVNVTHLDYVVATHPHEDHIGGLPAVLTSNISVGVVLYNGLSYSSQVFQRFQNLSLDHNLTTAARGQFYVLSATVNFSILNPKQPFELSNDDTNGNSIVLRLQSAGGSFLFTGDATSESETKMVGAGLNLRSDVLKVGHHGSRTSTSQVFLDAVNPHFAVISAGINNSYGHPHEETIQRLANKGIPIYGTYSLGNIVFVSNDAGIVRVDYSSVIPEFVPSVELGLLAVLGVAVFFEVLVVKRNNGKLLILT